MGTKTDFDTLRRAVRSVDGRLSRIRKVQIRYRHVDSPIQAIGCFSSELDELEGIYQDMANRLARAEVYIPD